MYILQPQVIKLYLVAQPFISVYQTENTRGSCVKHCVVVVVHFQKGGKIDNERFIKIRSSSAKDFIFQYTDVCK